MTPPDDHALARSQEHRAYAREHLHDALLAVLAAHREELQAFADVEAALIDRVQALLARTELRLQVLTDRVDARAGASGE